MSRRRVTLAPGRPDAARVPLYQVSFLIDPARPPAEQDYLFCAETWKNDASKVFRHDLESPIYRSLHELSGSGRYTFMQNRMVNCRVGQQTANRLILSIQIFEDRPEDGSLVADLNSLFLGFTAITPDADDFASLPVVRGGYHLELGLGRLDGDDVTIVGPLGGQDIKMVARVSRPNYEGIEFDQHGTRVTLGEDRPPDQGRRAAEHLRRLSASIEQIYAYHEGKKGELESHINGFLATQDPQSHEDRARIANIINTSLARAGFAIDFKGERCYLSVTSGKKDRKGRFRITPIGTSAHLASPADLSEIAPVRLTHAAAYQSAILPKAPADEPSRWTERVMGPAHVSQTP